MEACAILPYYAWLKASSGAKATQYKDATPIMLTNIDIEVDGYFSRGRETYRRHVRLRGIICPGFSLPIHIYMYI